MENKTVCSSCDKVNIPVYVTYNKESLCMECIGKYCEDCGKEMSISEIHEEDACADGLVGYGPCCMKYICTRCLETGETDCNKCCDIVNLEDAYRLEDKIVCKNCYENMGNPKNYNSHYGARIWYGISAEEWNRRYD